MINEKIFKVLFTIIFQIWHIQHIKYVFINSIPYYFQVFNHQYWYAKSIFLHSAWVIQGRLTREI